MLYRSPRLLDSSWPRYQLLLRQAFESGTDESLATALRAESLLKTTEQRRKPKGGFTTADVPWTAADTLAEGEFNRFYARGLCRRARAEGVAVGRAVTVQVYRAKQVEKPREASEKLLGQSLDPDRLLADLRGSIGVDPALGLPAGPNSGLSVRLRLA